MKGQQTIGIVGGGQLGRMLTLAALPLGFKVVVLNPSADSPAHQVGADEIIGDLYDEKALRELAERSDFMTVEIEHLDTKALDALEKAGKQINPAPATISMIQDKYLQKEYLHEHGVPTAESVQIASRSDALKALTDFGGKMLIKTRRGAYDGRGNHVVESEADLDEALAKFENTALYAEKFVPFIKELAVMVARSTGREVATYPVVETIHERNICVEVLAPASVGEATIKEAERVARQVAELLGGAGVFGIEMFLTEDGRVLVNEIAPRVHNSGHYTIEATRTSQFEQHIRAVTGLPLGSTGLVVPAAAMINILGERDGPTEIKGLDEALSEPEVSVHLYGKSPTKIDRKMGHITATGKTVEEAKTRAQEARKKLEV